MASQLSEMLQLLWQSPRDENGAKILGLNRYHPEHAKYYRNWGFMIYRTYHGPESDKFWDTLLYALKQQVRLAVGIYEDKKLREADHDWKYGPYKNDTRYMSQLNLFKDLFHLVPREDPLILGGLDIHAIPNICLEEHSEAKEKLYGPCWSFALVADEAVLKDIARGEFVIKAVGYDWDPTGYTSGWGWDRISTHDLLSFWEMLFNADLQSTFKYYWLDFKGPEEDLEKHIWDGDFSVSDSFGKCSRAQTAQPKTGRYRIDYQ
ncbi:hypothetical protein ACHAQK_011265 [Fusarium lateritium]